MNEKMNHLDENQRELLDLYALDALEGHEKEEIDQLVQQNDVAKNYVDETRRVLAELEDNQSANEELLAKIKNEIHSEVSHKQKVDDRPQRVNFFYPFALGAVAASVVALLISITLWPDSNSNNDAAFSLEEQVQLFAAQESVKNVSLRSESGQSGPSLMLQKQGDIMIDARDIDELDENYTYQLWAVIETQTGQQVISAGVLGSGPGVYMARVSGNVKAFAITKEVSGGVVTSSQDPAYISDTF